MASRYARFSSFIRRYAEVIKAKSEHAANIHRRPVRITRILYVYAFVYHLLKYIYGNRVHVDVTMLRRVVAKRCFVLRGKLSRPISIRHVHETGFSRLISETSRRIIVRPSGRMQRSKNKNRRPPSNGQRKRLWIRIYGREPLGCRP